ncbi:replicative DNA helicase [Hyphomicrobium sp.]|uniref:replicative DNA helicase n=1 Tax=Hyphomicrobium sp. TaxID=82 RepID=UPI002E326156|nr:replicative DNA helicase [Hyphomicrobium sp.]HEX2842109.1 replicative DNA helicase [Hyphomicrobium sp.]
MAGEALRVLGKGSNAPLAPVEKVPHSSQAEMALLGAIMVNNRFYDELEGTLKAEHFYVPLHAAVFEAIEEVINGRGGEANPITISQRLQGTQFDADKGLFPHLSGMFENATLAGDAKSLAEVIITSFRQRQLMGLAESVHTQVRATSRPEDVEAMLEAVAGEVFRLTELGGKSTARDMRQNLIEVIRMADAAKRGGTGITGIASGFVDLDQLLGGFQNSDFIVVGARPSMGKTSLLLNIAQTAATRFLQDEDNSAPVGVFSLEMSATQLTQRLVANAVNICATKLGNGQINDADMTRIVGAAENLYKLPLIIDDTPGLSISALRSRAREMKRKHNIGLIIVDYLQLMHSPIKGDFNRVQEITQISRGLKLIARELDIPVIAASQLSRSVESRDNKRPLLSDLRESGSIEQDADVVLMLYRGDYYLSRAASGDAASDADRKSIAEAQQQLEAVCGITELIVAKNRKGPTDTVKLMFDGGTTTFRSFSGG